MIGDGTVQKLKRVGIRQYVPMSGSIKIAFNFFETGNNLKNLRSMVQ